MANALGQMPNAPLIYVLAQIRFTHVPRMDKRWEDFHEKVLESYPKVETERIEQIAFKDGQPTMGDSIKRWHLKNNSCRTGIIVAADSLTFHTTEYMTSGDFTSRLEKVLKAFVKTLPDGVRVTRQGLRYVDLLQTETGLTVDKQVIGTLRSPILSSIGEPQRMEQLMIYKTPIGGTLIMRHRQRATSDILPADIFPTKLESAPRLCRERLENQVAGLLDYDHYVEQEQPFDIDKIVEQFRNLHTVSSEAFINTTTEEARTVWQKESN